MFHLLRYSSAIAVIFGGTFPRRKPGPVPATVQRSAIHALIVDRTGEGLADE